MKNLYLILLLLGLSYIAEAHEISGTVTDEDQEPIEGIGVYNKTTGGYTFTDISGYYELDDISAGDVIFYYGLGYESQEIVI